MTNHHGTSNHSKTTMELSIVRYLPMNNISCSSCNLCPPWFYCGEVSGECECKCGQIPYDYITCDEDRGTSAVLDSFCVTFDEVRNLTQVGACIYNCENISKDMSDYLYHLLPNSTHNLTNTMCKQWSRTGALCGRCLPGHYPLAYSFNLTCILCPHFKKNWWRYVMAAYLPLTFFYFVVLFYKINAVSSHLHPVIFYSQVSSISAMSRILMLARSGQPTYISIITKIVLSLYGIWNLDFFRPFYTDFCLGIGPLPTLALDYAIAVYPLLLMVITYLLIVLYDKNYRVITTMWRPFRVLFSYYRRNWNIRTSVIDAYATFFLLSNIKFLGVSFDLLVPTRVYELHRDHYNHSLGLYYAADIEYFGSEHLPYGILAIIMCLFFVILPVTIFVLYPFSFFQRFLNVFPVRWYILHTFMDVFQGCYKDGTEPGTRDCRYFAAVFLIFRVLLFVLYSFTLNTMFFGISSIAFLFLAMLIINIQPFKKHLSHYSKVNSTFLIFLAMFNVAICGLNIAQLKVHQFSMFFLVISMILGVVPIFHTLFILFYWIFSRRQLFSRIKALRAGYKPMDEIERDFFDGIEQPRYTNHLCSYTNSRPASLVSLK